jgi:hypothetical protein
MANGVDPRGAVVGVVLVVVIVFIAAALLLPVKVPAVKVTFDLPPARAANQ